MKTKICSYCEREKSVKDFGRSSQSKDGYEYSCRACRRAIVTQCERRNPKAKADRRKRYRKSKRHIAVRQRDAANRRKYYFGVPMSDYNLMLESQNGVCAICEQPETDKHQSGTPKTLSIDHDHETGALRGLLCGRCNKALGAFKDHPELLERAITYLKKHAENPDKKIIPFKKAAKQAAPQTQIAEANWKTPTP